MCGIGVLPQTQHCFSKILSKAKFNLYKTKKLPNIGWVIFNMLNISIYEEGANEFPFLSVNLTPDITDLPSGVKV